MLQSLEMAHSVGHQKQYCSLLGVIKCSCNVIAHITIKRSVTININGSLWQFVTIGADGSLAWDVTITKNGSLICLVTIFNFGSLAKVLQLHFVTRSNGLLLSSPMTHSACMLLSGKLARSELLLLSRLLATLFSFLCCHFQLPAHRSRRPLKCARVYPCCKPKPLAVCGDLLVGVKALIIRFHN